MSKVLVVAVHPDDETLGCAGTLLKHRMQGDEIFWLIITNISEELGFEQWRVQQRQVEINLVAEMYQFTDVHKLDFPTTRLETVDKSVLVKRVGEIINLVKPAVVYLPHPGDAHSEHKAVFDAVFSCTKSFRYPFVKKVLVMETLSETEFGAPFVNSPFVPNYFVDISDFVQQKVEIMKIYKSEVGDHPFPRSVENIKALGLFRGAVAGVASAEAFMALKIIE